jgi:hypothetical protein
MWHKFSRSDDDKFSDYPPEGEDVVITDGRSIDRAYYVYSDSKWIKFDDDLDVQVELKFIPTHWMSEEDYKIFERDQIINKLL